MNTCQLWGPLAPAFNDQIMIVFSHTDPLYEIAPFETLQLTKFVAKKNKDKLIFLGSIHNWAGSFEDPDGLQGDEGEEGEGEKWEDEW